MVHCCGAWSFLVQCWQLLVVRSSVPAAATLLVLSLITRAVSAEMGP